MFKTTADPGNSDAWVVTTNQKVRSFSFRAHFCIEPSFSNIFLSFQLTCSYFLWLPPCAFLLVFPFLSHKIPHLVLA